MRSPFQRQPRQTDTESSADATGTETNDRPRESDDDGVRKDTVSDRESGVREDRGSRASPYPAASRSTTDADVAHDPDGRTARTDDDVTESGIVHESHPAAAGGRALLRTPRIAPLAAVGGWASAWGVAIIAIACMSAAGIATGLGFGIADANGEGADGVAAGTWLAICVVGGFLAGGYVAARMARTAPIAHSLTAWVFAVLATAADGVIADQRNVAGVLERTGLPSWSTDVYSGSDLIVPLVLFALAALIGVVIGGTLGGLATRRERSPIRRI